MTIHIEEAGSRRLAVPLGAPSRGTSLGRILALRSSPGWLVEGNAITEWRFQGVTERDGAALLFGPWVSGRPLSEVLELPLSETLPFISRLAQALLRLSERRIAPFPIQTDAVLFTDDGSVLFLPPEPMKEMRAVRTFETNFPTFDAFFDPDLSGESVLSFTLAAMLYRVITRAFPFSAASAEDLHEQMRKLEIPAPARLVPGLLPEISDSVMAGLGRGRSSGRSRPPLPVLEQWAKSLSAWTAARPVRELSAAEAKALVAEAEANRVASEARFRRRVFWEKNWKTAAIIAAVVIVLGAGLGSILKGVFAPRLTRGYSPARVVETFYSSMNTLDHMAMSACVVGKAGQADITATMNLYVISRVSTGYEGRSSIVAADEWDKAGRPKLAPTQSLYGVTGLSIRQDQGEPTPIFTVSYDKWTPVAAPADASAEASAAPRSEGHAVTDRIFLKKDRGDWVIYRIDQQSSEPIPVP